MKEIVLPRYEFKPEFLSAYNPNMEFPEMYYRERGEHIIRTLSYSRHPLAPFVGWYISEVLNSGRWLHGEDRLVELAFEEAEALGSGKEPKPEVLGSIESLRGYRENLNHALEAAKEKGVPTTNWPIGPIITNIKELDEYLFSIEKHKHSPATN